MITFFCGLNETLWNGMTPAPGALVCVSPVYGKKERRMTGVDVPAGSRVLQDSGAFTDIASDNRLSFDAALMRQKAHAARYNYANKILYRASYDYLVPAKLPEGSSTEEFNQAAEQTIDAARYIARHRPAAGCGLVLTVQGATAKQYLEAAREIYPLVDPGLDMLGLGGFVGIGNHANTHMPAFRKIITGLVPEAAAAGVKKIHLWGVIYGPALGELAYMCDRHGLKLSTDSAAPQTRPVMGRWGYGDWHNKNYQRPPAWALGPERAKHVAAVRDWLADFDQTEYYQAPALTEFYYRRPAPGGQLRLAL